MSLAALVARGLSLQLIARFVSLVLALVSISVTVRYLGLAEYGVLTTVVVFSGLFDAFGDVGLSTVTVRRVTTGRGSLERLVGLNLGISIFYAIPLWLIATATGWSIYQGRPDVQLGIAIVSSGLIIKAIQTCFNPVYEVVIKFGVLAFSDISSRLLSVLLMLLAVQYDAGLVAFFGLQVLPFAVRLLIVIVVVHRRGHFRPVFARGEAADLLREGFPLALVNLVAILYFRVDGVLLSLLSDVTQVGAYGLAYRLVSNLGMLGAVFVNTVFPTMTRAFGEGKEVFTRRVRRYVEVMLLIALPAAIFGPVMADELIALVASEEAVGVASTVTQLLLMATAASLLNVMLAQALVAAHQQRFLLRVSIIALLVNVVINVALAPELGAAGAGIALLMSESLSLVLAFWRLRSVSGVLLPVGFVMRTLPSLVVTMMVWWPVRHLPVLIVLTILAMTYFLAVALMGPLRISELRVLIGHKAAPSSESEQ